MKRGADHGGGGLLVIVRAEGTKVASEEMIDHVLG
jgi:hypothetical protein